ncbi:MAG: ATP synthase F1 subunit delta [Acidobacteriota bacterium]
MGLQTIASRYARALADVTIERKESNQVLGELERFSATLNANPDVVEFFESPVVPVERKREVLLALVKDAALTPTTRNFLQLLLENYRLHRLEAMLRGFERELDRRSGIVSAEVTTARPIDKSEQDHLRDRLRAATGQDVRLKFGVDPAVIGGLVTKIGSTVYDGSIRSQLLQIKQQLARAK